MSTLDKVKRYMGAPGPQALVAHRCDEHRNLAPTNNEAHLLVMYAAEKRPTGYQIGADTKAECGGCIAADLDALYHAYLDVLDLAADAMTARAEMRQKLETAQRFGI